MFIGLNVALEHLWRHSDEHQNPEKWPCQPCRLPRRRSKSEDGPEQDLLVDQTKRTARFFGMLRF